jgi:hypothetical protein
MRRAGKPRFISAVAMLVFGGAGCSLSLDSPPARDAGPLDGDGASAAIPVKDGSVPQAGDGATAASPG